MPRVTKISDAAFDRLKPLLDQGLSQSEALDRLLSVGDAPGPVGHHTVGANEPASPFKPVCIWPNIRKWSKNEDTGEWNEPEEYDCPIRVEQRDITAVELSKNHCTKCPIFRAHEIKQKSKARNPRKQNWDERAAARGVPLRERYPTMFSGGANAVGWGNAR